jgi:hypothetical protein
MRAGMPKINTKHCISKEYGAFHFYGRKCVFRPDMCYYAAMRHKMAQNRQFYAVFMPIYAKIFPNFVSRIAGAALCVAEI